MSAELCDLRAKITSLSDCVLEAHARARDIDKSELVREILETWACKQVHAATLTLDALKREGITGQSGATSGNLREFTAGRA